MQRCKRISYKSLWKNKAWKCRIMSGFSKFNGFMTRLGKTENNFNKNIISSDNCIIQ